MITRQTYAAEAKKSSIELEKDRSGAEVREEKGCIAGAVALVIGTRIGSGILALPKKASPAVKFHSYILYLPINTHKSTTKFQMSFCHFSPVGRIVTTGVDETLNSLVKMLFIDVIVEIVLSQLSICVIGLDISDRILKTYCFRGYC